MGPQLDCPSDPPAETGTQTERRHAGETHTNTQESCVCVFERVREEKRREEKRRKEKKKVLIFNIDWGESELCLQEVEKEK